MADLGSDTSLVIALNEIEKKVIQAEKDRNDLETNLGNKGVDVTPGSKMSNLIDKVVKIEVEKHNNIPEWYPFKDTYIEATSITKGVKGHSCCACGSYIYVIGSSWSSADYKLNQRYDTKANTWEQMTPLPTNFPSSETVCYGTNLYILGGESGSFKKIICYNTITDTYTDKPNAPIDIIGTASVEIVEDNIYVISGKAMYCFNITSETWSVKTPPVNSKSNALITCIETDLYVLGGSQTSQEVVCYDTISDTWSTKKDFRTDFYGKSCNSIGDDIYIFGGYFGSATSNTDCYNVTSETSTKKINLIYPNTWPKSAIVSNNVYVIGGETNPSKNQCYCI